MHHTSGGANSELVDVELNEIKTALELDKSASETKWINLNNTPGNRKRTYIVLTFAPESALPRYGYEMGYYESGLALF